MPEWLRKAGCAILVLLAFVLSVSIRWGGEYCSLCGKARDIVSLNPCCALPGWGWVLSRTERATPLGAVAEPLFWPDPAHHQWVTQWNTCFLAEANRTIFNGGLGYAHPRYRSQSHFYRSHRPPLFAEGLHADPELARHLIQVALSPESDEQTILEAVVDVTGMDMLSPSSLEEMRAKHGLPPSGRYVAKMTLDRKGDLHRTQVTVTVTNAGTEAILVDRELVFGVGVEMLSGGRAVEDAFDVVRTLPEPGKNDMSGRLVRLEPGGAVTRTIDLAKGFRVFSEGPRRTWRERVFRLRPGVEWDAVRVRYDVLKHCPGAAVQAYTGAAFDTWLAEMPLYPLPAEAELQS